MTEIGIVIPTYNRKAYLHEAIDSILTQDLPPGWNFHIAVVDDGSADGTLEELCETFQTAVPEGDDATLGPQLTVLRKANGERGAARNYGVDWLMRNRSPRWLLFFDADDVMCGHCLYRFAKRIEAAGDMKFGGVYSPIHVWHDGEPKAWGDSPKKAPEGDLSELVLDRHVLALGGTLIDATTFLALGGFSEDRLMSGSEDWTLLCRLGLVAPIIYSPHLSVNYRQHPNNTPPQNYFKSLDLAVEAILPTVRERFIDREEWAIKQLLRQAALVKIGAVNSRGLWRDALRIFGKAVGYDASILLDWRAQRVSLSIAKRALSNFKGALFPGNE